MHYRTKDGDMLDAICWRYYAQQAGAVEANPGLADAGTVFPAGILIELPSLPEPCQAIQTLRLWD